MSSHPARVARGTTLRVAIAMACAAFALTSHGASTTSARIGEGRVIVPAGVFKAGETGVQLLHDYGAFGLYHIDAVHVARLNALGAGSFTTVNDAIAFNSEPLDASAGIAAIPTAFQLKKSAGAPLQIVQFIGPIAKEWLETLRGSGATVLQYIPNNAYVVRTDASARTALAKLAAAGDVVQFTTDYQPYYKLDTRLGVRARAGLNAGSELDITVQVVDGEGSEATRQQVVGAALAALGDWFDVGVGKAIRLHVSETAIAQIAQLDHVLAVEEYEAPHRMDERQDQIVAGNFNAGQLGPSAPGYMAWLTGQGFPTSSGSYPTVVVVDDGIGTGVASTAAGDVVFRINGDAASASRLSSVVNCSADAAADGGAGHGHLNTSIVGGYDARAGFPYVDPLGYLRGLGINPFVGLAHVKIFKNSGAYSLTKCSSTNAGVNTAESATGAAISSNSWGANTGGAYDTDAQFYDQATRDANSTLAGNQPMIYVFAAGNAGPGASTVGSPGTAKNVITVGASENFRPTDEGGNWTDGCNESPSGADNAMDVIHFSSRGPASAGRAKPEIIAPGTHVQGTASSDPAYDGSGVCDKYRPPGQTTFAASSGTSHSTPAMAGAASLVAYYLKTNFQGTNPNYATAGVWPSAAAMKAYMMAHTTYLTGADGSDNLPSNNQGYGMPNLARAFDTTTARYVNDQQNVLSATGQTFVWTGTIADTGKPVKIAMAFSDAPGATSGSPVVNNLDLIVTNNGKTYRGNAFAGQYSKVGGSADAIDNYEAVMLPPGTSGDVTITIVASNIAGDGVPNNGDSTDQDFALVCSNCSARTDIDIQFTPNQFLLCAGQSVGINATIYAVNGFTGNVTLGQFGLPAGTTLTFSPPVVTPTTTATAQLAATASVIPGRYDFNLTGTHGASTTSSVPATLAVSTVLPGTPILSAPANNAYGVSLTPTLTWSNDSSAFLFTVEIDDDPSFGSIDYTADVDAASHIVAAQLKDNTRYYWRVRAKDGCGNTVSAVSTFVTNGLVCAATSSTDVPKIIPSASPATVTSALATSQTGVIRDLDVVNLNGTHTYIGDLTFKLGLDNGPTVTIMDASCGSVDNFKLSLDDSATGTWPCPPVNNTPYPGNRYKPSHALSAFNGSPATGSWTLSVIDSADADGGTLAGWGLRICTESAPTIVDANNDSYEVTRNTALTIAAAQGVLSNDLSATGLAATVSINPVHGTLTLATNGGFTYTPATDYCGSDGFTYSATDGTTSDTATVALDVHCVPPSAGNDAITVVQGGSASTLVGGSNNLLSNDTDASAGTLTVQLAASPTHGSLTLDPAGTFSYTHDGSASMTDSFQYSACNATTSQCSTPATVTITVDLRPTAGCTISPQVFKEGAAVSLGLAGMFADPESATLTYSISGQPGALVIDASSGVLSGTVAVGAAAGSPYIATITAADPGSAYLSRTLTMTVLTAQDALFRAGFENAATICN
ncbi:MAG TPA: S8 family serine peptidase [Rudaea sp.]